MTTTAHEDQYLAAPEPVRQPYSTEAILRRNIASLEVALRTQTERAEAADAELAKLREIAETLAAEVRRLREQASADSARIDWLADVNNTVGSVVLPRHIVEQNISSLRQAIDAARSAKTLPEPAP